MAQPRSRTICSRRGWSCRSLAATEALAQSSDQPCSSTGPGFTCAASAAGSAARMASKRWFDSSTRCRSRASGALNCKAWPSRSASGVICAGREWGGDPGFGFTRRSVAARPPPARSAQVRMLRSTVFDVVRHLAFARAARSFTSLLASGCWTQAKASSRSSSRTGRCQPAAGRRLPPPTSDAACCPSFSPRFSVAAMTVC